MFSCEFCKKIKNTFLENTSGRLLLKIVNPFQSNVPFPNPLKISEKTKLLTFSGSTKKEHCIKWVKERRESKKRNPSVSDVLLNNKWSA